MIECRPAFVRIRLLKNESRALPRPQSKLGHRSAIDNSDRNFAAQPQSGFVRALAVKEDLIFHGVDLMPRAGIIESRIANHEETDFPADRLGAAHELFRRPRRADRYEIGYFGNTVSRKKARQENI